MIRDAVFFLLGFFGTAALVVLRDRLKQGRGCKESAAPAINVVHGRVLPMPDDPRWKQSSLGFKIGPVVVTETSNLMISGHLIFGDDAKRYGKAVNRHVSQRLLERAESSMLQKDAG